MPTQKITDGADFDSRDPLAPFYQIQNAIIQELEPMAQRLHAIAGDKPFPEEKLQELRQRFVSGVFDWALRQMNGDIDRLLGEGKVNYLDQFSIMLNDPTRARPRNKGDFWEAFRRAEFYIPSRLSRANTNHREWPTFWVEYLRISDVIKKLGNRKWRNPAAQRLSYKEKLPELTDKQVAQVLAFKKPSDQALACVRIKFKLDVDIEALKKIFRVFRKDCQYGYNDFVVARQERIKKS